MIEDEIILSGGMSTESVVRIGNTVHRTQSSNSSFIHAVLQYLEQHNFSYAPGFLGIDDKGREILSFITGTVPRAIPLTYQQKINAIKVLRAFHDLMAASSLCNDQETVCHNDFAPWNLIVNESKVVGVIDFDEAIPGKRIDDVTYFIWTALDLGVLEISDNQQIKNIAGLVNAYCLEEKGKLIQSFLTQQNRILEFRKQVVATEKDLSKKDFSRAAVKRIQKSIKWIKSNKNKIESAL